MEVSRNWKDVNMSAAFPVSWSTPNPSPHHPPACKRRRPINNPLILAHLDVSPHVREYRFRNPENFLLVDSWVLESGMHFKESGQRFRIQHLKSRIRDCLGFPYMERGVGPLLYTRIDKMTMRKVKFLVLGNDRMACPWLSVYDSTNTPPSDSSDILNEPTSQTLYSNTLYHWQRFLRPFYCWIDLPSTCLFGKCWNGHKLRDIGVNRLI